MKVFIDTETKRVFFGSLGNEDVQDLTSRQSEELVVQFIGASADVGTVAVVLKASAEATVELASVSTFTHASGIHTGWLDLNTEGCNALDGALVYFSVLWQKSGHDQKSDRKQVRIMKAVATGTEDSPSASSSWWTLFKAKLSSTWFSFNDTTQVATPIIASQAEAEAGTINDKLMTPLATAQAIDALATGGAWGDITGTLAEQEDLAAALDGKAGLDGPDFTTLPSVNGLPVALLQNIPNISGKADLDSPALTGTPTAPTATSGDSSTLLATTAFVTGAVAGAQSTSGVLALGGFSSITGKVHSSNVSDGFNAFDYGTPLCWYAAEDQGDTDATSVTALTDRSGNGYHATSGSNMTYRTVGGVPGAEVFFDNGAITLPDGLSVNSRSFSVVMVFRPASTLAQQVLFSLGRTSNASTGQLNLYWVDGRVSGYSSVAGGLTWSVYPHGDVQAIVLTGSASALTSYFDTQSGALSALTSQTFLGGKIGESYTGGNTLQGSMLHFAMYGTTLTAATIAKIRTKVAQLYDAKSTTTGILLCTVGDSITRGYGLGGASWPRQVIERLGCPVRFIPWGSDGKLLTGIASPDASYNAAYARKLLVVGLGTTDLDAGTNGTTLGGTLNTFCAARRTTGWQVIAINCLPRSGGSWSAGDETQRGNYNTYIATNWASFADAYIDAAGDSRLSNAASKTWYEDGTHPTAAGAAVLAEKVEKAIRSLY